MRILIPGANGMLGQDLRVAVENAGHLALALDRPEIDITSWESCVQHVDEARPDIVVNCAAWTAVDEAETQEAEAFRVNAVGASNLARAANTFGARLVQISTDYVFRGDDPAPQAEDGIVDPRGAYGRTKAAGEWASRTGDPNSIIIRTAWLYGAKGRCFPKTVRDVLSLNGTMTVVSDQHGQPTWTKDLADLIARLIENDAPAGTYHGTSSGSASWFEFAQAVADTAGFDSDLVEPTTSARFSRPAPRPAYSVLEHNALRRVGIEPIGEWRERWFAASREVLDAR